MTDGAAIIHFATLGLSPLQTSAIFVASGISQGCIQLRFSTPFSFDERSGSEVFRRKSVMQPFTIAKIKDI
ncbi:hypothetical protein [Niabella aquatica]